VVKIPESGQFNQHLRSIPFQASDKVMKETCAGIAMHDSIQARSQEEHREGILKKAFGLPRKALSPGYVCLCSLCSSATVDSFGRKGYKLLVVFYFLLAQINCHGLQIVAEPFGIILPYAPYFINDRIIHGWSFINSSGVHMMGQA